MELRTLKYFLTVLQEGSITNAAKRLHITQPTLSRQLAELEQSLGRQLYNRSNKGIIPTEHGAMLAEYAENILALAEKAEADVSLPAKTVSSSVHIGLGDRIREVDIVATYNLPLNVKFLVEARLRIALAYDGLIDGDTSELQAIPLFPTIASTHGLV